MQAVEETGEDALDSKAKVFKALGDPVRLRILEYLHGRDECNCICTLSELTGKDHSVIYRHLIALRDAGIIRTRKRDRCLYCCIRDTRKLKRLMEVVENGK